MNTEKRDWWSKGYPFSAKPAASERLEKHVLDYHANGNHIQPDLLVMDYGINEARSGTSVDVFVSELDDIIKRVRERISPLIVLLGPYCSGLSLETKVLEECIVPWRDESTLQEERKP